MADTTMMRIVHNALRRDLARARTTLAKPTTGDAQRHAIAAHLRWMMTFLRAHHEAEDAELYPLARARAGADTAVFDRMEHQHELIAPAIAGVETEPTIEALDALADVLLPHLEEEERHAMPVVARLVTDTEWQAIEKKHNLDPKSMRELGFEGHWLIDGASDADRAVVIGLVSPIPRIILLYGFVQQYRRVANACWGDTPKPPRRVQLENRVSVIVDSNIDDVWNVVRDVTRVGEWSRECVGATWLGDATSAVPGARFRGRNRAGLLRWGRVCEVISAEPYELVWRTVPTRFYPDSSEWRLALVESDGRTRITQQFHVLRAPKVLSVLYALMVPTHRDRTVELTEDLERLGSAARTSRMPV